MAEPWKVVICDSNECISEMFEPEYLGSPNTKFNQDTLEDYKIYPDIDNEEMTQFTCPRCGKVITWGVTRRQVAKLLHEKFKE